MMRSGFYGMQGVGQFSGIGPMIFGVMICKLVIFAVVVFIVYMIMKKYKVSSISAIRILNERYAKGEIEEEEYLKRKEVLKRK